MGDNTTADKDKLTIEDRFEKLDAIVSKLEDGNISLEESFELYKKGMEYVKECSDELNTVEKKVLQIKNNGETDEF